MTQRIIPIAIAPPDDAAARHSSHLQEQRLPRYTSYPPATEFRELGGDVHGRWLDELPAGDAVSLYLHIPYCKQLCLFCGCFTKITSHYGAVREYLELLLREIALTRARIGRRLSVAHVHFGGGSPTILEPADFSRLMEALRQAFDIQPGAEIAVEIDPRTVNREKCETYFYNGVNRVSLGVQDFAPEVQQAVNRIQPYELVSGVVMKLRRAGIERINLDLIYGLPYQTIDTVTETARLALTLEPQRLAVFGYAHVPWMRKHQRVLDAMPLPGPEARSRMSEAMRLLFTWNGFKAIGLDHYARENDELSRALVSGTLRRNFQGYTTDTAETLLGFGLSAISALPGGYAQNTTSIHEYRKRLGAGEPVVARGVAVTDEDRMRREIISDLMCYYHVNLRWIADRYLPQANFDAERNLLEELQAQQLIELEEDDLSVTSKGRPYVRAVCAVFDQYLKPSDGRYSLAV